MTVETASYIADLNASNPGSLDQKKEGDNHLRLIKSVLQGTFPGLAGKAWRLQDKTAGYTAVLNDNMSLIRFNGAYTLSLTAAATLGNGWMVAVYADGGAVTIDPNGSETVNGVTTATLASGDWGIVFCTGSAFYLLPGSVSYARTGAANAFGAFTQSALSFSVSGATSAFSFADRTGAGTSSWYRDLGYSKLYTDQGGAGDVIVIDDSGNVTADGNVTAYSDINMKENLKGLIGVMGAIGNCRGYRFTWKEGTPKAGQRDIGLIAQEIQAVFPEVVVENTAAGTPVLTLDYSRLVAVLWEGLKEVHASVKGLEASNKVMRRQMDEMRAEIEALKAAK